MLKRYEWQQFERQDGLSLHHTVNVYMLLGLLIIICGVLDHIMLVHILAPDTKELEEKTKWERS